MIYKRIEHIEVKTTDGNTVAFLSPKSDGLKEVWINEELNGPCTLEFEMPLNNEKWAYVSDKYNFYVGDKEFVINNPDAIDGQRDGKKLTGKIKAHESWILLGKVYNTITNDPLRPNPPWGVVAILSGGSDLSGARYPVGSAGHALYALLQGTGWTVGTVDVTGTHDLETEKESVLANINKIQELWGGFIVWDSVNKTVSLRDETLWQNYTGFQIRYAKNLKSISRTDDYDIITRLYPFGENDLNISNVNGGLLYVDNYSYTDKVYEGIWYDQNIRDQQELKTAGERQLAKMCRPRHNYKTDILDLRTLPDYRHENFALGDMVDIIDEDLGIDNRSRIINYRYNVFQPWLCELEIGDPIEKISASVAQSIVMAKIVKSVMTPNTSFQNLLKGVINTVATEINGANGDYTLVDGVSTWFDRDSETGELTGKLLRITPQGLIISHDGGQTWKLAISGEGIHAEAGWVGKLNAGVVTIGPETTFAPGYDPTQIVAGSTVGMGVDADCLGLWHFDGSLNSHKGVAVDSDADYNTGLFGQALNIATGKHLKVPAAGLSASQGTISFRAKNLSESGNGSVLIDLPESNNTQGIQVGIADDGKIFLSTSGKVSKSYTETTQSDFNSGTLTDVTATSAGSLELHKDTALVENGSFENITSNIPDNWTLTQSSFVAGNSYSRNTSWKTDGSQSFRINVAYSTYYTAAYWVKLSQTIDLTNIDKIIFDAHTGNSNGVGGGKAQFLIDGVEKWISQSANTEYLNVEIDTTNLTGNKEIQFQVWCSGSELKYGQLSIDNVRSLGPTYKTSGTREKIVDLSGANPAGGTKIEWSSTTPPGTSVTVETALSLDGGSTYGTWQEATNGGSIPGITTETDLSNARLKIRQTLSTTDTSKTPQLHSLSFSILESAGTAAYGPNKSTLTAWDSISLAWKPERLSLVVNDEEACFIENPSLPTALGSHIYIGTDRNGNNAINTLVDELRIDKVYREVNIRTGWHKTGVPFYTSEDMKQWPGYMKLETDGLKVYDSQDQLRVLLGSWLKDAVRKYGLKIIGGEIYSSFISTRDPDDPSPNKAKAEINPNGSIIIYDMKGREGLYLSGSGLSGQGSVDWYFDGTRYAGAFVNSGSDRDLVIWTQQSNSGIILSTYNDVAVEIGRGGGNSINLEASVVFASADLDVREMLSAGSIVSFGSKNCAEPTENYGIRLLNAVEAPELKYYDSGVIYLQNGEATVHLDPIFLECIEPDTELTPWQVWVQCYGENDVYVSEVGKDYFKVKERNGGIGNNKVVWRFEATRKNYAGIRLMEVVD